MQSITVHFRRMGRPLLALVALALIFESAPITRQAHAQPTPNDQRILQRIQPSGYRALRAANLNKAASEDVVVLDQRWMYEWNGSDFWQVAQTVYVYQGTTRTEEWQFVWNGQAMLNQSRTRYQVQSGRTLVELQEGFDPVAGEFYDMDRYTYEYTYDLFTGEPNHLHRMTHETKIDGVWRALERTTYEQPSGTRVTGVMDEWAGEEWRPIERFTMREEVAGVIQEVEERTGNEWTFTRRTTFPGYTIESLRETTDAFMKEFLDYAGLNIAAHLFPNYIAEDWNGFEWIPTERKVSLLMDPDVGNGLSFSGFVYESYVNDSWIPEQRLVRTHRMSDNRTIESTMALFTGANWTTAAS